MKEEKTINIEEIYNGNIIKLEKTNVLLPNGKKSVREIIRHSGASVIIPVDNNKNVYMVKQFRKPLEREILELPAGKLDSPDEDPKSCAIRELKEETGITAKKIKHIVSIHASPAFSDEILHLYLAQDLSIGETKLDDEELITVEKYHITELIDMIVSGKITDSKTIIGLLMLEKCI